MEPRALGLLDRLGETDSLGARDELRYGHCRCVERPMNHQNATERMGAASATDGHDEQSAEHLESAVVHARQLMQSLASYLRSTTPGGLIQQLEELARKQPSLALGGAFLLGMAAARNATGDRQEQVPPLGPIEDEGHAGQLPRRTAFGAPREPADPIGVGSPIGDAPVAGGSPNKGPL
jgi:hypothetical protein